MSKRDKTSKLLDAQSAQKILDHDLKNIVGKVSSGKPLTSRERSMIQQAAQERKTASSVKELLALLGLSRTRYYVHKKDSEAPDDMDLESWREYLSKKKLGVNGTPLTLEEITILKGRLLAERTEREKIERKLKELRLQREEGGWIPFEEAREAITRVLEPINRLLEGIPKRYATRINPADADYAEEALREVVAELKEQIVLSRSQKISKRKGVK